MPLITQEVYFTSRLATSGSGVQGHTPQGSHRHLFAAHFISASCVLSLVLFSSSVPTSPVLGSFLHSCIHLCVHPCLSPAAPVWGGNCSLCFVLVLFPLCQPSQPQLACTSGGGGRGCCSTQSPLAVARRGEGSAGCTGELCCGFRVGRAVCVVQ